MMGAMMGRWSEPADRRGMHRGGWWRNFLDEDGMMTAVRTLPRRQALLGVPLRLGLWRHTDTGATQVQVERYALGTHGDAPRLWRGGGR